VAIAHTKSPLDPLKGNLRWLWKIPRNDVVCLFLSRGKIIEVDSGLEHHQAHLFPNGQEEEKEATLVARMPKML
jgi:hypothetical protein